MHTCDITVITRVLGTAIATGGGVLVSKESGQGLSWGKVTVTTPMIPFKYSTGFMVGS